MRLALIHISQETNDFNPRLTTLDDYRAFGIFTGTEMLEKLRGFGQVGGHIEAVERSGLAVETVPIIRGRAGAGGRITREAFDFFATAIREGLQGAGRLDGLALQLHGACAAEGVDDVEGEQLALCRAILGPDVPIVLGLDHHANITDKIMANCTAIVGHRTQPHDPFDTGVIGTELLIRIITERLQPVMAWRKIPLVTHQEQFLTAQGPMKAWFDRARAIEAADPHILQASNYPMQPWLDVAEGGWSTVVVTDGDQALAERTAEDLADLVWSMRDDFLVREAVTVDAAVQRAIATPGLVVLSDTGDTVFGGAAGDSNLLLEALLHLPAGTRALVPLISPDAARRLAAAGEGAEVTLPLGGDSATAFFTPLEVTGTVRKVGGGTIRLDYNQQSEIDVGTAVIFEAGPVTLMITEKRGVAGNVPAAYRAMGVDPADYRMAVLKTASNFQYFAPIATTVIRVDTRGPGQSDVHALPWQRLPRPIHPLDPVSDWQQAAQSTREPA